MTTNRTLFAVAALAGLTLGEAVASPYDDCILEHIGMTHDKEAVRVLEQACINKTSVPISTDPIGVNASAGKFSMGGLQGDYGLLVTLRNSTNYDITEVLLVLTNKADEQPVNSYRVRGFHDMLPDGVWLAEAPDPAVAGIIKSDSTRRFFVRVDEVADYVANFSSFWNRFGWYAIGTKAIPK